MQAKTTRAKRARQRPPRSPVVRHAIQPLLWPSHHGPVFHHRRIRVETMERVPMTADGGLALAHQLVTRVGLDRALNEHLALLKFHLPYHESDHLLTHAYNLFVGGRNLEDIASLQHSPAIKNLLGACRIPDPTTAGDFLRRFGEEALRAGQRAVDQSRIKVWKKLPRQRRKEEILDMDSTFRKVYGECKEGADFSYKGEWSYHPLLFTLAGTGECLRLINRPGNRPSAEGAAEELGPCLDLLRAHFERVYLRGDSKFAEKEILRQAHARGVSFAIVHPMDGRLRSRAWNLKEPRWRPFRNHSEAPDSERTIGRRRRRARHRRRIVRRRGYLVLSTVREWVAEIPYRIEGIEEELRLVLKRKWIEEEQQGEFFRCYQYQAVITNIPRAEKSAAEVTRFAYGRCNQENAIEQAKNGLNGLRMPTGSLLANGAFLLAAQIAWCLKSWLSLLALPGETGRWEWSWFRRAFVHAPAEIVCHSRSAIVRLAASHRFTPHIQKASSRIAVLGFG